MKQIPKDSLDDWKSYVLSQRHRALKRIGLFHVHVSDKAGFCLICGYLSRPEKQIELIDWDFEYDDPEAAERYDQYLLRQWGYNRYTIKQLLSSRYYNLPDFERPI